MKRLFTILSGILLTVSTWAQIPQKMSYQAVIRNSSNLLVSSSQVRMRISILQGSTTGTAVYVEIQSPTTNANGLVTIEIGGVVPLTGTFSEIDWSTGPYYIRTETDPTGGTNYTISGTSQLLSVPYALYAKTASGYSETDPVFVVSPAGGITGSNISNWITAYGWGNHASAGYVPNARTMTLNGTTLDLSLNRSWSVGTVTSVGLSLPSIFSLSGSPVTTGGTLTVLLTSQPANRVFASPDGIAGGPSFRVLGEADIPNLSWNKITSGKPTTLSGYGITDAVNTNGNQIIAGNKSFTGITTVPTPVNPTDAATKAYIDNALKESGLIPNNYSGNVSDIDGNVYKTVTIGTQTWMSENLRVARYNDGIPFPLVTDNTTWSNLTIPGYCWYNNDAVVYKATYGALYNWYAASTGKLCPAGWHVPTDTEWTTLTTYLGGYGVAGGKLKERGTAHWISPNQGATNESGFTALPLGSRTSSGSFTGGVGSFGDWWSASESGTTTALDRYMGNTYADVFGDGASKKSGFSVRCLRD